MLVLAIAYPLLVHVAVLWPNPWLEGSALAVLCAIPLYEALRAGRAWAWMVLLFALAASAVIVKVYSAYWLLLIPPVAIPLSLLLLFGHSLRAGRTPLVTRMATAMEGPLPPEVQVYTRRLTWLWVIVFASLIASAVLLALLASRETWSWATNFLHYIAIAAVFVVEYAYRRWRFRHRAQPGFLTYIRGVARQRPSRS